MTASCLQVAGARLVSLLKGADGMATSVADGCRAVLLNAAESPEARKLLCEHLPPAEQNVFLGPLPTLPPDYRYQVFIPVS